MTASTAQPLQLRLFEVERLVATYRTVSEAGLRREIKPGPGRLLAALVRHGLDERDEDTLRAAAALAIELEQEALAADREAAA